MKRAKGAALYPPEEQSLHQDIVGPYGSVPTIAFCGCHYYPDALATLALSPNLLEVSLPPQAPE